MAATLAFWAVSLLIAAFALPIAFVLMRRLSGAGAGLAFPLGLVLVGYLYFILRVAGVLSTGAGGYLIALVLLALLGTTVASLDRRFVTTLRVAWPGIVLAATVFTLAFVGYVFFRSYQPQVTGTEQPMDFMYLNATLTSPGYPPHDPWLAGEPASYYYFGYLQIGALTSLAGVTPSTGYNLGLAYVFAAAATGMVTLVTSFVRWALRPHWRRLLVLAPLLGAVLLLFLGSLSAGFEWAAAHGYHNRALLESFGLEWLVPCGQGVAENCFSGATDPRTTAWYPTEFWFWWRGTRIIPGTITEFPFFSFLLGDLHPHLMALPLVLLSLGVSATAWRGRSALSLKTHVRQPLAGVLLAVIFGALAFQNAWDVITFSMVFAVAVLLRNLRSHLAPPGALLHAASYLAPIFVLAVLLYLPWYLDFRSQASGIYPYIGAGTRPAHAFLQFGPLLLAALLLVPEALARNSRESSLRLAAGTAWIPLGPVFVWMLFALGRGELGAALDDRGTGGWITLAAYAASTWLLVTAFASFARRRSGLAVPAGFATVGALLLLGAELFFIRDVFYGGLPRLNTVFKLTYQAWVLLSAAGAVGVATALDRARRESAWRLALVSPVALLIALGLIYPLIALPNRTEGFGHERDIDGLAFLARTDPEEYALTRWVKEHTDPGEIILEATGRAWRRDGDGSLVIQSSNVDYTDAGRISARTGRQALIGWWFHEVQWRGDTPENRAEFTRRQDLVDAVYTAPDPQTALERMRETGATYLVVSRLEYSRYPGDIMPDFGQVLDLVFEHGNARVYRRPAASPAGAR